MATEISTEELELMALVYIKLLLTKLSNNAIPKEALGVTDESLDSLKSMNIIQVEGDRIRLTSKGTQDVINFFQSSDITQKLDVAFFSGLIKKYPEVMSPAFSVLLTYAVVNVKLQEDTVKH